MKMKFAILWIGMCCIGSLLHAQPGTWLKGFGGPGGDDVVAMGVDAAGNSYLCGNLSDDMTLQGTTISPAGMSDIWVASFDVDGDLRWAQAFGGPADEFARTLTLDGNGNLYVAGEFLDSTIFDTDTIFTTNPLSNFDAFIMRLDLSGAYDTAFTIDSTAGGDFINDMEADGAGNLAVTGKFRVMAIFGTDTLKASAYEDLFLAKMSPTGTWLWARQTEGKLYETGNAISIMGDSAYYVTGWFQDTTWFNDSAFYHVSTGAEDLLVMKYSSNGAFRWVKVGGGTASDRGEALEVAGDKVFVAGSFDSTLTFGTATATSAGEYDAFFLRLDASGNPVWLSQAGGPGFDVALDLAVGANGVHSTGFFQGDASFGSFSLAASDVNNQEAFVSQMDLNGAFTWVNRSVGPSSDEGHCLAVTSTGFVVAAGQFVDTVRFNQAGLGAVGIQDIFLISINSTGGVDRDQQAMADVNFRLFPNPTAGPLRLEISGLDFAQSRVEVYDNAGQQVLIAELGPGDAFEFDFSTFPAGMYYLRVDAGSKYFTQQFILTH